MTEKVKMLNNEIFKEYKEFHSSYVELNIVFNIYKKSVIPHPVEIEDIVFETRHVITFEMPKCCSVE